MNLRIKAKTGKAVRLNCTFDGTVRAYADAWLRLTNNAREYPNVILKYANDSGNGVTVITLEKHAERVKKFLTGMNCNELEVKIWSEETVPTITPMIDWAECEDIDYPEEWEVLPAEDVE